MKCIYNNCAKGPGHVLILLSVVALILSAVVSLFGVELYLAGTQWILVSILLALYASIFFNNHGKDECGCEK